MTVSGSSNRIARDVGAHQAAAERDLLLGVRRQAARAPLEDVGELQHLRHLCNAASCTSGSATPRLRSGKARLSNTVIVS